MTKEEMLEGKIKSLQIQLNNVRANGTQNIQYAEKSYFSKRCKLLKYHTCGVKTNIRNTGVVWDGIVRIAKSFFEKRYIYQLTYEQANLCVDFLNRVIDIINEYEEKARSIKLKERNADDERN